MTSFVFLTDPSRIWDQQSCFWNNGWTNRTKGPIHYSEPRILVTWRKNIASTHGQRTTEKGCLIIHFNLFDFLCVSYYQPGWWQTMDFVWSYHLALLSPLAFIYLWGFLRKLSEGRYTVGLCFGLDNDQITVIPCGSTRNFFFKIFISFRPITPAVGCVWVCVCPRDQETGWENLRLSKGRNSQVKWSKRSAQILLWFFFFFFKPTDELLWWSVSWAVLLLLLVLTCSFAPPKHFHIQPFPLGYKSKPSGGEFMKEEV